MMQGQLLKREEELKQLNSHLTDTKDQNQQLIDVLAQTAETVQSALKVQVIITVNEYEYIERALRVLLMVVGPGHHLIDKHRPSLHMFQPPLYILGSGLLAPMDGRRLTMP